MEPERYVDVEGLPNDFSFAFDNPAFSDRILHLKVRHGTAPFGQLSLTEEGASVSEGAGMHSRFVHVSTPILAGRSPYFMRLLNRKSGFREATQKSVTLEIAADEEGPMMLLLQFIFGGGQSVESVGQPEEIKTLLMLADRFEVRACAEQCVRALARLPLTLSNSLFLLTLPEGLQQAYPTVKELLKACSDSLVSKFRGLSHEHHFEQLKLVSLPVIETLLRSDLIVESEEVVFEVLVAWIRFQYPPDCAEERCRAFAQLVPLIRFPFMSGEYLHDCAMSTPELGTPLGRELVNEALWFKVFTPERRHELARQTTDHSRYRMRRYGQFVSFSFSFRREQFVSLTMHGGSLQSPQFKVEEHSFDVKISRCNPPNKPGTYAMFIGLWRVGDSTGSAMCEFLVQTQPDGEFVSPRGFVKGGDFPGPQQDWSFHDWLGAPWDEVVGLQSPYMKDGVMTIRAEVLILNPAQKLMEQLPSAQRGKM